MDDEPAADDAESRAVSLAVLEDLIARLELTIAPYPADVAASTVEECRAETARAGAEVTEPAGEVAEEGEDAMAEGPIPARFLAAVQGVHHALIEGDVRRLVAHLAEMRSRLDAVVPEARETCAEVYNDCAGKASTRLGDLAQESFDAFQQALGEADLVAANMHLSRTDANISSILAAAELLDREHDGSEASERAAVLQEMAAVGEVRLGEALTSALRKAASAGDRARLRVLYRELCLGEGREAQASLAVRVYTELSVKTLQLSAVATAESGAALTSLSQAAGGSATVEGAGAADAVKRAAARMFALVEKVAELHTEVVAENLPPHFARPVTQELHADGCRQLLEMIAALDDEADVEGRAAEVEAAQEQEERRRCLSGAADSSMADGGAASSIAEGGAAATLALDLILQELAGVLQLCAAFFEWLADSAADLEVPGTATGRASPPAPSGPGSGSRPRGTAAEQLHSASQALACKYMNAELAYSRITTRTAIRLAEVHGDESSLVEDTFFVVLKCFQRASSSREVMLVVLPLVSTLTESVLRAHLGPALLGMLRDASPLEADSDATIVALNSLQCAVDYAAKLGTTVRSTVVNVFGDLARLADEAVADIEGFGEALREKALEALGELAESMLPTAWLLLEWQTQSYVLEPVRMAKAAPVASEGATGADGGARDDLAEATGDGGAGGEAGEVATSDTLPAAHMVRPLVRKMEALRERLRPAAHATMVEELARRLAGRMEEGILAKRFNELGAIQLAAEVRLISEALSGATDGSVRHCFSRLTQMAFLLNAASVGEATALMVEACMAADADEGNLNLAAQNRAKGLLTASEACRVVSLRVEFAEHDFTSIL